MLQFVRGLRESRGGERMNHREEEDRGGHRVERIHRHTVGQRRHQAVG